jgi:hypothetical protein
MTAQNRARIAATASIIFDAPLLLLRLTPDPGFKPASSGLENGFARIAD